MSTLDPMHAYEGMDLNLNFDIPSTPSQMDSMFYPMLASFEQELKPLEMSMPSSFDINMNIQQVDPSAANFIFDPVPVKPEIISTEECLDCWQVHDTLVDFIFETTNETLYVTETTGVVVGDHFQLNGVASGMNAGTGYFVNVMDAPSQTFPYTTTAANLGDFSVGRMNPRCHLSQNEIERRKKRMIKNRESAARSRARRLAFNAQQKLEIQRLKKENESLKKTLTAMEKMNTEQGVQITGISRTFSEIIPPMEKL